MPDAGQYIATFSCGCVFGSRSPIESEQRKSLRCPLHHTNEQRDEYACCRKRVPQPGGYRQDGETWICPVCLREFVYVIDEAEGGSWVPA